MPANVCPSKTFPSWRARCGKKPAETIYHKITSSQRHDSDRIILILMLAWNCMRVCKKDSWTLPGNCQLWIWVFPKIEENPHKIHSGCKITLFLETPEWFPAFCHLFVLTAEQYREEGHESLLWDSRLDSSQTTSLGTPQLSQKTPPHLAMSMLVGVCRTILPYTPVHFRQDSAKFSQNPGSGYTKNSSARIGINPSRDCGGHAAKTPANDELSSIPPNELEQELG